MNIKASDIRKGMVVTMDGVNFVVVDFAHRTPGNLRAFVQAKLKNLSNGSNIEKRLRSDEQLEVPFVESREFEYLYSSGDEHVFMDVESYDQVSFAADVLGDAMSYLMPNTRVQVRFIGDKPASIELPASMDFTVTETDPALPNATAKAQYKDAVLESGLKVKVPPFIAQGERIRVDTRTGEYLERVK